MHTLEDGGPGARTRKGDDIRLGGVREAMRSYRLSKTHTPVTSIAARCITVYPRTLPCRSIAPPAAMQSDNLARMGNIAVMDHTSTKWSVRLEQGRSRNRVLRNKVRHSMEQSLKPRQGNRAQDRDQERLRLPRSTLRHIHSPLDNDIEQMTVPQTKPTTPLQ
jgi:hypothetical protein